MPEDLSGFRVGVTADRRGDDQEVLLRRLGLDVMRGPVLRTERGLLEDDLRVATEGLLESPPDFLVANTGFGVRAWWERAAAWGLDGRLTAAAAGARIAARGPKAAGAVRSLGLPLWWRAPDERLGSVVDHLVTGGVAGARVALQLHGDDCRPAVARLHEAGAAVAPVPVYRWEAPADSAPARRLVELICAGEVDAVTFTSAPAVRGLVELADGAGLAGDLADACRERVAVVCVGPVCAAAATEEGLGRPAVPDHWRLGAMVTLVGEVLARRRRAGNRPA